MTTPSQHAGRLRSAIASKLRAVKRADNEARRWEELAGDMRAKIAAGRDGPGRYDPPAVAAFADAGVIRCRAKSDRLRAEVHALRAEVRAIERAPCGARCRDGHACRAPRVSGARRCKLHGGKSTGARTPEGRERCRAALARARLLRALAAEVHPDEDPGVNELPATG